MTMDIPMSQPVHFYIVPVMDMTTTWSNFTGWSGRSHPPQKKHPLYGPNGSQWCVENIRGMGVFILDHLSLCASWFINIVPWSLVKILNYSLQLKCHCFSIYRFLDVVGKYTVYIHKLYLILYNKYIYIHPDLLFYWPSDSATLKMWRSSD